MNSIHILFPVLNEERRVERGLSRTLDFARLHFPGRFKITVVDNGSTDSTPDIAQRWQAAEPEVSYTRLEQRGVGLAVRTGCLQTTCDIVGYMDIDLSTDLEHLLDVDRLFQLPEVSIVNGSRLSRKSDMQGRKWYRSLTSYGLKWVLKANFGTRVDDAVCGFKFFRADVAHRLIAESSDEPGWAYLIELLLRAEKEGREIVELPVRWKDDYDSSLEAAPLVGYYMAQIRRLKKALRRDAQKAVTFPQEAVAVPLPVVEPPEPLPSLKPDGTGAAK